MSDTPRTDAEQDGSETIDEAFNFARKLERKLAAAIASFNEERERAQREGARVIELQVKLAEAVAAERERCAKVCDEQTQGKSMWVEGARACAAAIRGGE